MLTIPEIDEIAKRATERIAKEFAESGFANPPVVTHGIARAVIEAAEQYMHPTGLSVRQKEEILQIVEFAIKKALHNPPCG